MLGVLSVIDQRGMEGIRPSARSVRCAVNFYGTDGMDGWLVMNEVGEYKEAGSRKQEAGSRKQEAGSKKQEAGSKTSASARYVLHVLFSLLEV